MQRTLRHKINGAIVVTFLLIAVVFTAIQLPFQKHRLQNAINGIEILLQTLAERDLEQLANEIYDSRLKAIELRLKQMLTVEGVLALSVFNDSGKLLVSEGTTLPSHDLSVTDMEKASQHAHFQRTEWQGEPTLIFTRDISFLDEHIGFIRIYFSLMSVEHDQRVSFLIFGALLGSILLVMLTVLNIILSRSILYPIRYLRDATQTIARGNLGGEIKMSRKDELGNLADSFAGMRDAIKEKINDLKRLTTIMESTSDLVAISTPDKQVVYMNSAGRKMVGWSKDELLENRSISDAHPKWAFEKVSSIGIPAAIANGTWESETVITGSNGREIPVSQVIMAHKTQEGELEYLSTIMRDISERKLAEAALMVSQEKYRTVLEANPDPVVVYDMEGSVTYLNPAFTRVFGWTLDERLGKKMDVFVPEKAWQETQMMIDKVLAGDWFSGIETYRYRKNGDIIPVNVSGAVYKDPDDHPVASIINLRDITDQKKMEAQLRQAQKMQAVGTLAGGISHDFNNLLQAISGYTQLLLMEKSEADPEYLSLKAIQDAGLRASTLISQLLLFSRRADSTKQPIELQYEVEQAKKMLERTIPKMIQIKVTFGTRLWTINADPVQMEQMLLNLGTNAADAMPDGGKLLFEIENSILDDEYVRQHIGAEAGKYLMLSVSDTGHGMDKEITNKIFEPFFTTKEFGRGTGLGLASVYGIVKSHGGYITCYSEVGQGTIFKIYFPAMESPDPEVHVQVEEEPIPSGTETILLVDDEESIRSFAQQALSKFGYTVITASTGEKALEFYSAKPNDIDLILLDLGMPGMGGHQCLQKLLQINLSVKVIITSGYSINGQVKNSMESGAAGYVGKPYKLAELLNTVRKVLDEER